MFTSLPLSDLLRRASGGDDTFHLCCDDGPLVGAVNGNKLQNDLILLNDDILT